MQYIVTTRDTDGSDKRVYKNAKNAIARFEEMFGHSIDNAIVEQFHHWEIPPTFDEITVVRGVSTYGCVVTIQKISITDEA
jgi:hypothetical protein